MVHLAQVFQTLTEAHLKVKIEKCCFVAYKVEFLRHQISANGIEPNVKNIEALAIVPTPKKVKDIQSFFGLWTYYRQYIKNFCKIAKPLHTPLKKDAKFVWFDQENNSFQALKEKLTQAPILAYPDFKSPFLYTNSSENAAGFNLTQAQDGLEQSILYGGRNFSDTEKKYSTTEREALPVIIAIGKCRSYLLGSRFTIVVDHQALRWLIQLKNPTGRLARWALNLQSYYFEIKYRPGKKNGNVDVLSRRVYTITESSTIPQKTHDKV